MIQINFLPQEFRARAKTPVKVIAATAAVTTICASLLAFWAYLSFGVLANAETELQTLKLEMDGLRPRVAYHDNLQAETKVFASREQTLAEITKNRVLWTKKLDELIDVVNTADESAVSYTHLTLPTTPYV